MIIAAIILLTWFLGWVAAIYPINKAIVRAHVRRKIEEAHDKGHQEFNIDRSIPVVAGIVATLSGMFWPIFLPFYLSALAHDHKIPSIEGEISEHVDREFPADIARRQIAEARKELQSDIGVGELLDSNREFESLRAKALKRGNEW